MPTHSREVHLVRRPEGAPVAGDFALVETEVADPGEGDVLVRNLLMSVDPAMRPRMSAGQELGEAMAGGAIGRVEKSRHPTLKEGELVNNRFGFREAFVSDGKGLAALKTEPGVPLTAVRYASKIVGTMSRCSATRHAPFTKPSATRN